MYSFPVFKDIESSLSNGIEKRKSEKLAGKLPQTDIYQKLFERYESFATLNEYVERAKVLTVEDNTDTLKKIFEVVKNLNEKARSFGLQPANSLDPSKL